MKDRWWLAASLVLSLGLAPLGLAQEGKTGGMEEQKMIEKEQTGEIEKKSEMKDNDAMMKDKDAMMKDKNGMMNEMEKH